MFVCVCVSISVTSIVVVVVVIVVTVAHLSLFASSTTCVSWPLYSAPHHGAMTIGWDGTVTEKRERKRRLLTVSLTEARRAVRANERDRLCETNLM